MFCDLILQGEFFSISVNLVELPFLIRFLFRPIKTQKFELTIKELS